MTSQPLDVVRQIYDAFSRQDVDETLGLLDEDVHWILPEGHFRRGEHHGRAEMRDVFESHSDFWDSFEVVPENFIEATDGRILVLGHARFRARGSSETRTARLANLWQVRDGLAIHHEVFIDSAILWRALGARPDYFD